MWVSDICFSSLRKQADWKEHFLIIRPCDISCRRSAINMHTVTSEHSCSETPTINNCIEHRSSGSIIDKKPKFNKAPLLSHMFALRCLSITSSSVSQLKSASLSTDSLTCPWKYAETIELRRWNIARKMEKYWFSVQKLATYLCGGGVMCEDQLEVHIDCSGDSPLLFSFLFSFSFGAFKVFFPMQSTDSR